MAAKVAPAAPGASVAEEAWELMMELFFAQRGRMMATAQELDLSPPQLIALKLLDRPRPMGELAQALHCDSSNVTGITDRLEQRGLAERRAAEHDRRVKLIVLTDEGRAVRQRVIDRQRIPPPGIAGLSAADQRTLRDILRRATPERA